MQIDTEPICTGTRDEPAPSHRVRAQIFRVALASVLALWLTACGRQTAEPQADQQAQPALTEQDAETSSTSLPPDISDNRQLVVWLPTFVMAGEESPAAEILSDVLVQFEQAHPNTDVELVLKEQSGPAGLLSYLRSAQRVAPAILPDLVLLETQDLWRAVDLGLAQPLGTELSSFGTFYPSARAAVRYQDQEYGIPFALDLLHGVATDGRSLPPTWDALLQESTPYVFAGAQTEPALNPSLLLQYAAAGGEMSDDALAQDPALIESLLEFYRRGLEASVIPQSNATLVDSGAAWRELNLESPMFGLVSAKALLGQRDALTRISYGFPPAAQDEGHSLVSTYAFSILATEPEQIALATDLISRLLEPAAHGEWSRFAQVLPSTPAALNQWGTSQDYFAFLDTVLQESSTAIPNGRVFYEYAKRVQTAQNEVLSGRMSPEEALTNLLETP